jgi:hypothetical protein
MPENPHAPRTARTTRTRCLLVSTAFFAVATISPATITAQDPPGGVSKVRTTQGPWGKLETYPIRLEPPDSHLWAALYDERSIWGFGERSPAEAVEVLRELAFSPRTLSLVSSRGRWSEENGETIVEVDDETVESLTAENRAGLARWLRLNNPVFFGKHIVNLEGGDFSSLEQDADLSPDTIDLVRHLAFRRRNVLSLFDRAYILRKIGDDPPEKQEFLRAIFASPGLVARLVIDEDTDLEATTEYWSAGGRNPGVGPLLEAVRATTGVERIDLVQILPAVARRYLNSFTNLRDITPKNAPDCFWASIQFFKPATSSRTLDQLLVQHHLGSDFEQVEDEAGFGDVVCMFDANDGSFLHSYVHIAGDVVFSKNGASFARPFILTRRSDMLSVYLDETAIRFETYRLRPGV